MKFLDQAKIYLRSGNGGDGCVAFRREKYVEFGGPDGGDGGKGGNVVVEIADGLNTLIDFRYRQHFKAQPGVNGSGGNSTGATGKDSILLVPPGTQIYEEDNVTPITDLTEKNTRYVLCRGGMGGRGNARFKTSTNQAPRRADSGEGGEERWVWLRLKLIADAGLVGLPNAGKSTLFNAWLGQEGVTVSPHPGTTRDAVEANLILGEGDQAFEIALVDTAGFWELAPRLDQAALHQTRRQIENSWCVIWVLDATSAPDEETISWIKQIPSHHLRVLNRCDLGETWSPEDRLGGIWIRGSTLEGASQLVTQLELSLLAWTGTPPLPLD